MDLKQSLESIGSGLAIRVGRCEHVVGDMLEGLGDNSNVEIGDVWITKEDLAEEADDEEALAKVCSDHGVEFRTWLDDEKYLTDE